MTTEQNTIEQATRTELYQEFVQSVPRAKADDGTFRGARHGAFTAAVTVASAAVAALTPGFYPVRLISKNVGVQGWALRVAAVRMQAENADKIELLHGTRGNPSVIHVK